MDENNNKAMESARALYAYLKDHCVGKQISTWDLAQKASLSLEDNDLWAVHEALWRVVEEEKGMQILKRSDIHCPNFAVN